MKVFDVVGHGLADHLTVSWHQDTASVCRLESGFAHSLVAGYRPEAGCRAEAGHEAAVEYKPAAEHRPGVEVGHGVGHRPEHILSDEKVSGRDLMVGSEVVGVAVCAGELELFYSLPGWPWHLQTIIW